jgi:type I restriction enzyme, S subunit
LVAGAGDFDEDVPRPAKYTTQPTKLSTAGDILLGIRASIGNRALADRELCLGRGVAALRAGPNLSSRYLWHWLGSTSHVLATKARGATFKQVNREDIGSMLIPVPPIGRQRRIARLLDAADTLRIKRHETLSQLGRLTKLVFVEMFGDPVSNTRGWPTVPLETLGSLDRGVSKHRPRNAPDLLGGPYPLIQTGDVATCDRYLTEYRSTYSEMGLRQSKLWPAGTLCITIAANIARVGVLTFDACFPDSVVGFTADTATTTYVWAWLLFLQQAIEDAAPQSAQKNINLAILRELLVPVPSLEERGRFAAQLEMVETLKRGHRKDLAHLDALFASLQDRAFKGEL